MKKFLILLLSITLFSACSDDDDASSNGSIVGTWFLVEANNVPYTIDECTGRSNITFNADNTASSEFYSSEGGECDFETDTGNWSNSSDSQYTIKVPGLNQALAGTVDFSGDNRFTFTPNDLPTSSITFERQ